MIITAYKRLDNGIQVYNLVFNEKAAVPTVHKWISIECDLYIHLTYHCLLLPLLEWFRYGSYCTLIRYSMLGNFASYTKVKGGDYKKKFEKLYYFNIIKRKLVQHTPVPWPDFLF